MFFDSRLNSKHRFRGKQIKEIMRLNYIGQLEDISKKTLLKKKNHILYVATIEPIWTPGIRPWSCAIKSNIEDIQSF